MKVLLIVPCFNEEENILKTTDNIKNSQMDLDYIIINDGSTDKTLRICEENNIPYIDLINNLGIGGAVQTGYKYAFENNYDIAIQFDGDGQHDINYIKDLIEPLVQDKSDFVVGSRFLDKKDNFKSTKMRRIGKNVISALIRILTGKKITDPTSGFRACNKKVIKKFAEDYPKEYPEPVGIVTLLKNKYRILEVPVEMKGRVGGVSSIKAWKAVYYMINVILYMIIVSMRRDK